MASATRQRGDVSVVIARMESRSERWGPRRPDSRGTTCSRRRDGRSATKILICSCEDTMPLDADAVQRGCRGAEVFDRASALPRRARQVPRGGGWRRRRCSSAAPRKRRCSRKSPASVGAISYVNIRETAGWSKDAAAAGPKMAALLRGRGRAGARTSLRQLQQRRRDPDLRPRRAGDRGRQPAEGSSRRHRADQAARRVAAAAGHRFPRGAGHDPLGQGPSRRVRADGGRLRPAGARRRAARLRFATRPATARCRAATSCSTSPAARRLFTASRPARRLSARRSRRSRRRAEGRAQGARSRRHFRQAALHRRSPRISAPIRARRSSAATAASTFARPARSRPPAIMSRSMPISARAADNAPPSARPAPPPMRCRRPMR